MKIGIIKLSSIGDIVHTSIVLQFIKMWVKDSQIYWFCDDKFADILEENPLINELIRLPLKTKKFLKTYQILQNYKGKFDLVIDFQGLIKSSIVARVLSPCVVGFDKFSTKEPLASIFYARKLRCDYDENIIIRNLNLASYALNSSFTKAQIQNKKPCFYSSYEFEPQNFILIAPFASEKSKCYCKFKDIIKALDSYDIFVSYAGDEEKSLANELITGTKARLLEPLSLSKMIAVSNKARLVIGNDSGITHLAWAQNRPSITIFGNRPSHRNAYATDINLVIDSGKNIKAKSIDKSDFCINDIDPNLVINAAKRLLNA